MWYAEKHLIKFTELGFILAQRMIALEGISPTISHEIWKWFLNILINVIKKKKVNFNRLIINKTLLIIKSVLLALGN